MCPAKKRIEDGISELLMSQGFVFVGYCLTRFMIVEGNEKTMQIPTMGVTIRHGSIYLYYNKEFTMGLDKDELLGVLEHEVLHVLHVHMVRRNYREPLMFNYACDYAINPLVKHKLPAGALLNPQWKDHSAEWIYDQLEKQQQQGGSKGNQKTPGAKGQQTIDDHSGWDDADEEGVAEATARAMAEEAMSKSKGDIPGGWEELVKELLKSKVNWKQWLRYYYSSKVRLNRETSWKARNRRLLAVSRFAFPGQLRRRGIEVVVAVDTSGSIGQEELGQFFGELESLTTRNNAKVFLVQCDAEVTYAKEYRRGDWNHIGVKGRGGTDFRPVYHYIDEHQLTPSVLIYLTDCQGTFPDGPAKYETLWVSTIPNAKVPWGKLIPLEIDKPK